MAGGLKEARSALRRGDADAALVALWNALEPARIEGDRRALRTIEQYATQIARAGDEGQQREATRLIEVLHRAVEAGAAESAATSVLEGEVTAREAGEVTAREAGEEEEVTGGSGVRLGTILWLLILIAIVVLNVLGQTRE
jgi:hypothetical protein